MTLDITCVENVWSFDPFQSTRVYKFRLKSSGEVIRGRYICEKTKGQKVDPSQREFVFLVGNEKRAFTSDDIVDPQYSGI